MNTNKLGQSLILFLLIGLTRLIAQEKEVKIIDILDANLFLTKDSLQIQMVNLNVPSINGSDSARSELAKNIVKYARIQFKGRTSRFIPSYKNGCSDNSIQSGHLYRKYLIHSININKEYLENGYAVYLPCDTLFMDEYREASERAMKNIKGVWALTRIATKPDYFNRLRSTYWVIPEQFEAEQYFPIFGFNYRWSNLYSFVNYNSLNINMSAEAGTYIYFVLPYANIGTEFRYKNFYVRAHYDAVIPFFPFIPPDKLESYDFYGIDIGFILQVFERSGVEIEFNIKPLEHKTLNLFSISFVAY